MFPLNLRLQPQPQLPATRTNANSRTSSRANDRRRNASTRRHLIRVHGLILHQWLSRDDRCAVARNS